MGSREVILQRLQQSRRPFPGSKAAKPLLTVSPLDNGLPADTDPSAKGPLLARFIREAEAISCRVDRAADRTAATEIILEALEGAKKVLSWDPEQIPCDGLLAALRKGGIEIAAPHDDEAPAGLTGAQAALAASGSLVLVSGRGRPRTVALLPQTHIAVITQDQILPHMEAWVAVQRTTGEFAEAANINIISGPSRTADIAMEPILGMHGPAVVHIVIVES